MYLVHWVEEGLDPNRHIFDPAIFAHSMALLAISRSGGSKMVDQCGSRLDQGRTFIGFETSTWMISDTFLIVYGTVHLIISKQLELSSIYGLLFSFQ